MPRLLLLASPSLPPDGAAAAACSEAPAWLLLLLAVAAGGPSEGVPCLPAPAGAASEDVLEDGEELEDMCKDVGGWAPSRSWLTDCASCW